MSENHGSWCFNCGHGSSHGAAFCQYTFGSGWKVVLPGDTLTVSKSDLPGGYIPSEMRKVIL